MVYQKRYNGYSKRKMYRKRRYNNTDATARKALYLARKAQNQKELKYHSVLNLSNTVTSSGEIVALSGLTQGDTNNERDGNVIYPTSVALRLNMISVSTVRTKCRVIIFKWLEGTTPSVSDILDTVDVVSFKSDGHRFESKILYDRTIVLDNILLQEKFIQKRIKLDGLIAYNETSSVPSKNGIYMLLMSDQGANFPTFSYETRLYFKDA